jgi:hypothetical protein
LPRFHVLGRRSKAVIPIAAKNLVGIAHPCGSTCGEDSSVYALEKMVWPMNFRCDFRANWCSEIAQFRGMLPNSAAKPSSPTIGSPVMRLFKLLVMCVICLGVVGFWQGWFSVSRSPSPDGNADKTNLNVSIDREKMRSDIKKVEHKVKDRVKERAKNAEAREKAAAEKK